MEILKNGRQQKMRKRDKIINFINENTDKNLREIADVFNVSKQYIGYIIKKYNTNHQKKNLRIPLINFIKENPDKFIDEIANHFGVTITTIRYYIRRYNVLFKKKRKRGSKPGKRKNTSDLIRDYIKDNKDKNIKQIAEYFNVTSPTICFHIKKYNIPFEPKKRGRKRK